MIEIFLPLPVGQKYRSIMRALLPDVNGERRVYRWRDSARKVCSCETTTEPSPTAEATRLTEPARTSPTAKMPCCVVSCGIGVRAGSACGLASPVQMKPLASTVTGQPLSHSVFG